MNLSCIVGSSSTRSKGSGNSCCALQTNSPKEVVSFHVVSGRDGGPIVGRRMGARRKSWQGGGGERWQDGQQGGAVRQRTSNGAVWCTYQLQIQDHIVLLSAYAPDEGTQEHVSYESVA